ncbi:hypothetical protein F3Y22_tig00112344pilonHSYRG00036 [Hibiscus syriacus]|uniref:Uncharacterized protein n=1 Tax=Hibiscus syriacus TaxID=106335 RepID=A0A6A2XZJ3_HIBSY|nr:hypothetical protein F3Y22_tig00112344pilonHSYRG00036 [Hibiscus syriacus]
MLFSFSKPSSIDELALLPPEPDFLLVALVSLQSSSSLELEGTSHSSLKGPFQVRLLPHGIYCTTDRHRTIRIILIILRVIRGSPKQGSTLGVLPIPQMQK